VAGGQPLLPPGPDRGGAGFFRPAREVAPGGLRETHAGVGGVPGRAPEAPRASDAYSYGLNLVRVYVDLALEPWCFSPDQIALYRGPQLWRLDALRREHPGPDRHGDWDGGPAAGGGRGGRGGPPPALHEYGGTHEDAAAGIKARIARGEAPSADSLVALYTVFGMRPDVARAEVERQLKEFHASRAAGAGGPKSP
jgi:hypothetical protein